MNRVLNLVVTTFLMCLSCVTFCGASPEDKCGEPCGKPTPWDEFNRFELKVEVPKIPGYSSWKGTFDKDSSDIQIDVEISDGNKITKGKIFMVGGRVLVTRGPVTEPGYEIDALDAPVLEQELVFRLLGTALASGPEEIKGAHRIDWKSEKTGIQFATPSAEGFISAPWRVSGDVNVVAPNVVEYQLRLTAAGTEGPAGRGGEYDASFDGRLSKVASARIDDLIPLGGWNVFGVGVQTRKEANGTAIDYGAAPSPATYKTVADIRKKLADDDYPGEPDPSKNFSGFWKEDCDQAFGLQVMHYGTDGKYSIVFCGPGGCGVPGSEGRTTFITKDSHFEVISENEIRERRSDGWDTYHRCTKDMHPVLKYKEQVPTPVVGEKSPVTAIEVNGQSEKDPNRPPCNTSRCQKIKAFLKAHYCGESPFGNGPDDGCDTRLQKPGPGTKVIADFICRWTSKCQQEGQPSPEIRRILIGEMRQIGLPAEADKEVHFTVLEAKSLGWSLMAANYGHLSGADLSLCQVILVADQVGQVYVLRKVPLKKTNADAPEVTTWSPVDIADVDGDGRLEIVLAGDAYEDHWIEVVSIQNGSFTTIFSGLGYYL
jgi:hypothetical protein